MVYKVSSRFGLTPNLAALLTLAATALITGALHEDGLADTADGLGGGRTRERKLEIMRDSRIGTYGVCALILSFGLRWSALAAIANPWAVALALCAAHTAARAGVPAFMSLVPPARSDGLSASAGSPPGRSVAIAFAAGTLALALALGPGKALVSLILLSLAGLMLARLAIRQIGGQTGDILGAFEQTGEILDSAGGGILPDGRLISWSSSTTPSASTCASCSCGAATCAASAPIRCRPAPSIA